MRQRGGASKNNGRPTELVFVNPGHADHLKKVIYRREIDGRLTARIEGDNGGKVFAEDYPYARPGKEGGGCGAAK